jgi:hypothetical protein
MGSEYLRQVRQLCGDMRFIVDKLPHNFVFAGLVKIALPNAKIIHADRNPMDNCWSIYKNFFSQRHDYAYDLVELGQYYRLYLELMDHWYQVLPDTLYRLKYEELVADQEAQTRKLLEFCGLPWEDSCLAFHKTKRRVKTVSSTQVRKAMYTDSVELWRRFETQLQPLHRALYGE